MKKKIWAKANGAAMELFILIIKSSEPLELQKTQTILAAKLIMIIGVKQLLGRGDFT